MSYEVWGGVSGKHVLTLTKDTQEESFFLLRLLLYLAVLAWNGWCCLATVLRTKPHTEEGVAERSAERYV